LATLLVLLPPRDPGVRSEEWQLPDLPFLLLDKRGRTLRTGSSALVHLPRANLTVLLVAARDLLMLSAKVPPLKGPRLRQMLPNLVEDQLIQDPQTCHVALDPAPAVGGRQMVAVIDRSWFRFVCDAFAEAGHHTLRAVPVSRCLPLPLAAQDDATGPDGAVTDLPADAPAGTAEPAAASPLVISPVTPLVAAIMGTVESADPARLLSQMGGASQAPGASPSAELLATDTARFELVIARGAFGEGMAVPAQALNATLDALAGGAPLTLLRLVGVPGTEPGFELGVKSRVGPAIDTQPLPFEVLARNALACRFNLCQFEFAPQPLKLRRGTLARWRVPVVLALVTLAIAIIGVNAQWLLLARQRDAINAQMTSLLMSAFPKTTAVLDAPTQMNRSLEQLRVAAGELSPGDFLTLADGLARALPPVPPNTIQGLDYRSRQLDVTFKAAAQVDDALTQRLARNGLDGTNDQNKWTIRSSR
jgi:general secretion pathway protein L